MCRPPLIHSENPKIRYDLYCYRLDSFLSECVFEPPTLTTLIGAMRDLIFINGQSDFYLCISANS